MPVVNSIESLEEVIFGHTLDSDAIENLEYFRFYTKILCIGEEEHLLISKFKFHPSVMPAKSSESDAQYLLWNENKTRKHGFLLQYLPSNSMTSAHHHMKQMELFHTIHGECYLKYRELYEEKRYIYTETMNAGKSQLVSPLVIHQILTKDKPCINIIEIYNVDYKDHVDYKEDSQEPYFYDGCDF